MPLKFFKKRVDLTQVDDENALKWVEQQNLLTDMKFPERHKEWDYSKEMHQQLSSSIRFYEFDEYGEVYFLLKNEEYPNGVYIRTTIENLNKNIDDWEKILDPEERSTKIALPYLGFLPSPNKDVGLLIFGRKKNQYLCHEYNLKTKKFVHDGMAFISRELLEAKWVNDSTMLIVQRLKEGDKIYQVIKLLRKGEALESVPVLHRTDDESSLSIGDLGKEEAVPHFFEKNKFQSSCFILQPSVQKLPIPMSAVVHCFYQKKAIIELKEDWQLSGEVKYEKGSIIALDIALLSSSLVDSTTFIFKPSMETDITEIKATANYLLINTTKHYECEVRKFKNEQKKWVHETLSLPVRGGHIEIKYSACKDSCGILHRDLLTSPTFYYCDLTTSNVVEITKDPEIIDEDNYLVREFHTESSDGTMIPYRVIHRKDITYDGKNPTMMTVYSALNNDHQNSYLGHYTKNWLERGGVFVNTKVRGSGRPGSLWHQLATLVNRHKSHEDLIAVAEDLIAKNITTPTYLGIKAFEYGSVIAAFSALQRPELFKAVVCVNPILDGVNFLKYGDRRDLINEYGNPEDSRMLKTLRKYSPLHQVKKDAIYPPMLFYTFPHPDISPVHARQMTQKLKEMGHEAYLYEVREVDSNTISNMYELHHIFMEKELCKKNLLMEDMKEEVQTYETRISLV